MELLLADLVLVVHFLVILFVLGGEIGIVAGGVRRWSWVRRRGFRIAHIVAVVIVAAQAWLGMVCPLTIMENALRQAAGESGYSGTFVGHWVSKLVYYDAPPWVFVTSYTLFALIVLASWFLVKPVKRSNLPQDRPA